MWSRPGDSLFKIGPHAPACRVKNLMASNGLQGSNLKNPAKKTEGQQRKIR